MRKKIMPRQMLEDKAFSPKTSLVDGLELLLGRDEAYCGLWEGNAITTDVVLDIKDTLTRYFKVKHSEPPEIDVSPSKTDPGVVNVKRKPVSLLILKEIECDGKFCCRCSSLTGGAECCLFPEKDADGYPSPRALVWKSFVSCPERCAECLLAEEAAKEQAERAKVWAAPGKRPQ